jgi:hypothetical protein
MIIVQFLDAHAGAGQVILAAVLVGITWWYARSADRQTKAAEIARLTSLQPYVFPTNIYLHESAKAPKLRFSLHNIGSGPAIGIRLFATSAVWPFQPSTTEFALDAHKTIGNLSLDSSGFRVSAARAPSANQIGLRVEYWDVFGRFWASTARIGLEGLDVKLQEASLSGSQVHYASEEVFQIDRPYIFNDRVAIERDLNVGRMVERRSAGVRGKCAKV